MDTLIERAEEWLADSLMPPSGKEIIRDMLAVVKRLPKTADGAPITVGMNLAIIHNIEGPLHAGVLAVTLSDYYTDPMVVTVRTTDGSEYDLNADACYSTIEAAEQARKVGA